MGSITEYLLSITAAAIICVIVRHIMGTKSTAGNMVSVVAGVFMLITVLSPLLGGSLQDLGEYFDDIYLPGDETAMTAVLDANEEMKQIIKEQSEAYILEEAKQMSLNISVEVTVGGDQPPMPESAVITGSISPYNKERLTNLIWENFRIPQEKLQWK